MPSATPLTLAPLAPAPVLAPLIGLRFFAAAGIVVYHYGQSAIVTPLQNIISHADQFVSLFFILSGFILTHTYLAADNTLRTSPKKFWQARIARILPVYLLALLLAAPAAFHLFSTRHPQSPFAVGRDLLEQILLCLTFTQAWLPKHAILWNGASWSLSVEAFFYLLFPWLAKKLCRLTSRQASILIVGLWLLSPLALWLISLSPSPSQAWLTTTSTFSPVLRLPEFCVGILLARIYRFLQMSERVPTDHLPLAGLACTALALPSLVCLLNLATPTGLATTPWLAFVFHPGTLAPLFALLILGLALGGGPLARLLATRPLRLLGEASYSFYILHMAVVPMLGFLFPTLMPLTPPQLSPTIFWPLFVGLVALSVLVFLLIEQPASRWLRQRQLPWLT